MKKSVVIVSFAAVFALGIIVGQHSTIRKIIAQELQNPVPSATLTPTPSTVPYPTIAPQITTVVQPNVLPTAGGGPRNDIVEVQQITANKTIAQVGDDISFTVTIKNQAPYDKLIKQLCFNSTDGNFGCTRDFNLYKGQTFNFNNSGRFTTGGVKTVSITWTQDGQNFYRPLNAGSVRVTIQN